MTNVPDVPHEHVTEALTRRLVTVSTPKARRQIVRQQDDLVVRLHALQGAVVTEIARLRGRATLSQEAIMAQGDAAAERLDVLYRLAHTDATGITAFVKTTTDYSQLIPEATASLDAGEAIIRQARLAILMDAAEDVRRAGR